MGLEQVQDQLKDYAKDIRINLANVLGPDATSGLTERQNLLIALAAAYATRQATTVQALLDISGSKLTDGDREGAKAASTIMAMNNVYYRTMHFFKDEEFTKKPARLRMTIIGKPGIDKVDFELASLAVSAVAGCKGCVLSHAAEVQKHGVSPDGVQTVFRIAATVNALATAQFID